MSDPNYIRLNKYLSDSGVCSRREADIHIEQGNVMVDGQTATVGMKILRTQTVMLNHSIVIPEHEEIVLAVHKPRGIVCTTTDRFHKNERNIVDFLNYPKRVYPIGRLDKDSEGLLLMTNQGELVNALLKSRNGHEKEYIVTVNQNITNEFIEKMQKGIPILETITKPCRAEKLQEKTFRIILTQGLNRQIRRMCEYCGYQVVKLKRVRFLNVLLGDLKIGEYRELTEQELAEMKRIIDQEGKSSGKERDRKESLKEQQNRRSRGSQTASRKTQKRNRIS